MLIKIHPETPQKNVVQKILSALRDGHVLILPTDTVYAFACALDAPKGINELYRLKNIPENQPLSLLCRDVAMASHFASTIANPVFRFMKSHTPGPYTFIFKANRNVDKRGMSKRKTVGIRIVDHPLHRMLMEELEVPLISTSLTQDDEYFTDPEALEHTYGRRVAMVVDDGIKQHQLSTVLDCSEGISLVRRGIGDVTGLDLPPDEPSEES